METPEIIVEVKKNFPDAKLPTQATPGSACYDLYAQHDALLGPDLHAVAVDTGLSFALPEGWEIQIRPRSGLAAKHGIQVVNSPGTVDADYRGPVKVLLRAPHFFEIRKGDRIAQMKVSRVPAVQFMEVDVLTTTERGAGGFGSTGT